MMQQVTETLEIEDDTTLGSETSPPLAFVAMTTVPHIFRLSNGSRVNFTNADVPDVVRDGDMLDK